MKLVEGAGALRPPGVIGYPFGESRRAAFAMGTNMPAPGALVVK